MVLQFGIDVALVFVKNMYKYEQIYTNMYKYVLRVYIKKLKLMITFLTA